MTKYHCMGVINITPDSFSDGGLYNCDKAFAEHCRNLLQAGVDFFDVGAESTAPFNEKITFEQEKERWDSVVLSQLPLFDWEKITFSIDTYKSEIFSYLYNVIKKEYPCARIIWNDVSGVLDEALFETLTRCPDVDYVFAHTNVNKRGETQKHMNQPFDIAIDHLLASTIEYFESALEMFSKFDFTDRIILDPCFGFSKTEQQNHALICDLYSLISRFPKKTRWLLGISRKSFLKSMVDKENLAQAVEYLQVGILSQWMRVLREFEIIFRVHDPSVFKAAMQASLLFDPKGQ